MKKQRREVMTFLAGVFAVSSFLILSSMAVVWANGLRFNPSTGSFEQTVLIAIDSKNQQKVSVLVNGEVLAEEVPQRFRNLLPGRYEIELRQAGFHSWRQIFWLSAGQVGLIEDPILIAEKPLVSVSVTHTAPKLTDPLDLGLVVENGELRDRGVLITRFSQTPLQVHRINDYYIYQTGSELRLFIAQGSQEFLVYTAASSSVLPIKVFESTWQLLINDNEQVKLVNLTIPQDL